MPEQNQPLPGGRHGTVSVRILHPLLSYFRSVQRDVIPLLSELALQPQDLLDPETRISELSVLALCRRIAETTQNRAAGLHAIHQIELAALPSLLKSGTRYPVVQALAASPTVGEGLRRFCQFYHLAHDTARFVLRPSLGRVDICLVTSDRTGARDPIGREVFVDYALAVLLHLLRGLAVPPVIPLQVFLTRPEPAIGAQYAVHFGVPVRWAAGADGFVLSSEQLTTPLHSASPAALSRLDQCLAELQAEHEARRTLSGQVQAALAASLEGGSLSSAAIARGLGMSVRTLTRRLQAEGTSYQKLLDEVRSELATHYLQERQLPSEDVARRLGFSETSALLRAFRRWHGKSLTEYRRRPPSR